ncbi:RNA polymerase-binding protein RbpA [Saccharothrix sp. DSM 118769]
MLRGSTPWPARRTPESVIDAPEPGWLATYQCLWQHSFTLRLARTAAAPATWQCRRHGGRPATLTGPTHGALWNPGSGSSRASSEGEGRGPKTDRPGRTPWQMLRERRTIPELEALLRERLELLHSVRR